MKNFVRAFALSLVVTGAFASSHLNKQVDPVMGKTSALPIPSCPPGDPTGCGMCRGTRCVID